MIGVDKYVTEPMPTAKEKDTASVKNPLLKQDQDKSLPVSFPVLERKWIDIETQRSHDHKCYEGSKAITRLLLHESVPRGIDGAFHCKDIIEECRKKKCRRRFTVVT